MTAPSDIRDINKTRLEYTTRGLNNKKEIVLTSPSIKPWHSDDEIHFGEAGEGRAIAWVRFGDTTDSEGNRVLVIDEIKSNRHQEGRKKGYTTDNMLSEDEWRMIMDEKLKASKAFNSEMRKKYNIPEIKLVNNSSFLSAVLYP